MKPRVRRIVCHLAITVASWVLCAAPARAQESLVITCENQNRCNYRRVFLPTVQAGESVRLVAPSAASGTVLSGKGRTVRLSTLPGLYREPESGRLRVLSRTEAFGDVVLPSKLPRGSSMDAATQAGWTVEYREQPKSKVRVPVPPDQFVALIRGPRLDDAVVEFLKRETLAVKPHPLQAPLVAGGLQFAGASEELRGWRDELRNTMRRSLDLFRKEGVDPARMEATLAEGFSAIQIFRLIAPDARENVLQDELATEYNRLLERFVIARVLKNSKMHDAFLEKLSQIGLARWSRSDLVAAAGPALNASAEWHHRRSTELFASKQYAGAFDEARLASSRLPCDEPMSDAYYRARVEFVNRNMIPTRPEPENENRSILQQIVRELQGIGQEPSLTPERVEYARKRIVEGERLDKDYLPLQLKKAEFLANIGELTASREVVTRVERTVSLGRNEAEEWLHMDASLNGKLLTLRQRIERLVTEQIANGQFKEAVDTAAIGLGAEPEHPRFLYFSAVASAVLRDQEKARHFVERYLRRTAADCTNAADVTNTLFDLYRRHLPDTGSRPAGERTPNWVSGELYPAGDASYDAISGSFNPRIVSSVVTDGKPITYTHFVWEGFQANSIRTTVGAYLGERQAQLELEPVYEQTRVYMTGIGTRANSAGQRRIMPLRFLNSPDYDPALAAKFTGKMSTRGWAGNPFFHPFVWTDIFLFDLRYDELGRIKEAIPVAPDVSRPVSSFSEPLTFTWEGSTRRLLAITGARYRRELVYNKHGLLVEEKITHASAKGKGRITYTYKGDPAQLTEIFCEDDFYDKAHRKVLVAPPQR